MRVSWPIEVPEGSAFTIENIPFGIFSTASKTTQRVGTAIGEFIVDLSILEANGIFKNCFPTTTNGRVVASNVDNYFGQQTLNSFAALPSLNRSNVRNEIIKVLNDGTSPIFTNLDLNHQVFAGIADATMYLPMCSRTHVDNNGRASSIVVSGTSINRPKGIVRDSDSKRFTFKACKTMDYEVELGFFISKPVPFGHRLKSADNAQEHIFGFLLLNDWSARDIQFTEMLPLGPFHGKGSATSISPWIVTLDALEGALTSSSDEEAISAMSGLPEILQHNDKNYTWDIALEASLKRSGVEEKFTMSNSNLRDLYWSPAQMLAYHASSGCGLLTGDLLGTGTLSSPDHSYKSPSLACLYELTAGGTKPVNKGDHIVTWIEDGDTVLFEGRIRTRNGHNIGFGGVQGTLLPCVPILLKRYSPN